MGIVEYKVTRTRRVGETKTAEGYTLGILTRDGVQVGYTLEDEDRKLESGGAKVFGKTAIPRGRYLVKLTYSNRFRKMLPQIMDVPGYEGVRIHGANTAEQLEGCIAVGVNQTPFGVSICAPVVNGIVRTLEDNDEVWLEVA